MSGDDGTEEEEGEDPNYNLLSLSLFFFSLLSHDEEFNCILCTLQPFPPPHPPPDMPLNLSTVNFLSLSRVIDFVLRKERKFIVRVVAFFGQEPNCMSRWLSSGLLPVQQLRMSMQGMRRRNVNDPFDAWTSPPVIHSLEIWWFAPSLRLRGGFFALTNNLGWLERRGVSDLCPPNSLQFWRAKSILGPINVRQTIWIWYVNRSVPKICHSTSTMEDSGDCRQAVRQVRRQFDWHAIMTDLWLPKLSTPIKRKHSILLLVGFCPASIPAAFRSPGLGNWIWPRNAWWVLV